MIRQQVGQLGRGLSKEKIGEFLSKNKPFHIEVLEHFTNFAANGFKGKPVDEALDIQKAVYDEAIKFGFSEDKANLLASNAYSAYYDMWFHGSEIVEQTRASGGSWEESDAALDKWLLDPNNQFNKCTNLAYGAFHNNLLISFIIGDLINIEKMKAIE